MRCHAEAWFRFTPAERNVVMPKLLEKVCFWKAASGIGFGSFTLAMRSTFNQALAWHHPNKTFFVFHSPSSIHQVPFTKFPKIDSGFFAGANAFNHCFWKITVFIQMRCHTEAWFRFTPAERNVVKPKPLEKVSFWKAASRIGFGPLPWQCTQLLIKL